MCCHKKGISFGATLAGDVSICLFCEGGAKESRNKEDHRGRVARMIKFDFRKKKKKKRVEGRQERPAERLRCYEEGERS